MNYILYYVKKEALINPHVFHNFDTFHIRMINID